MLFKQQFLTKNEIWTNYVQNKKSKNHVNEIWIFLFVI